MHAKEEGIIRALKEISKTENEVAKKPWQMHIWTSQPTH